ncbi:hypothetical protein [Microbacterium mangrovi]|uniref:hypothetical protein n=1 Tax=Microbacterium mangrovi TaxID=1348253 RepID=UPI00068FA783|nr:hypothetical protein [Microbacterium mangrovi]
MSSVPEHAAQRRARIHPVLAALLAVVLAVVGLLTPAVAPAAHAADLSKFDAGNIISDAVFFHKDAMTQAQIQSFLNAKVPTCKTGYTCLKSYRTPTGTYKPENVTPTSLLCTGYTGLPSETAAAIIYKVAQACGINPKVLIVMLQKEQGLVTSTAPSTYAFQHAMGNNCPDTTGCTGSGGFFSQVYLAARQLKRYANPPGTSQDFTWFPVGGISYIQYNTKTSCGSKRVIIANQATADLYYYTPYVPNAAALAAGNNGYGTGDTCSSYGNRNFYNFFTDWFGSTQVLPFVAAPVPTISGTLSVGSTLTANAGTWSPSATLKYQWYATNLTGTTTPITGATASTLVLGAAQKDMAITVRVTASKATYATTSKTSVPTLRVATAATPTVSGTPAVGYTLTANHGTWTSGTAFSYAWYANGAYISGTSGATHSTFTPTTAQTGKKISVKVTGTKTGYGTVARVSGATALVAQTAVPTISGVRMAGATLTANHGTWTTGTAFSYAWYANGAYISGTSGPTHTTYRPTTAQVGQTISVKVTGTLSGYPTISRVSAATTKVALTAAPTIAGTAKVGATLTARPGTWTTGTAFTYRWYASGTAISGATRSTFTPTTAQRGKTITVVVTGTKAGYQTISRGSAATPRVA